MEVVQKMQFNAEAMALRSVHDGCIKWIAVHLSKPKGYILSWYGGTIRLMLNRERAGSIARMFTLHFAG
jgi:hypothetical protein